MRVKKSIGKTVLEPFIALLNMEYSSKIRPTRGFGLLENFLAKKRSQIANNFISEKLRNGRILDIGCGTTPFFLVNTRFNEKFGIDPSLSALFGHSDINLMKLNFNLAEKDSLPFADNFFDAIVMLAVFEHIEMNDLIKLIEEIKRILKPGGRFIITTPTPLGNRLLSILALLRMVSSEEYKEHKGAYSGAQMAQCLVKAGFDRQKMSFGRFELFMNNWFYVDK